MDIDEAESEIGFYSYKLIKWASYYANSHRHLSKMIFYLCEVMRGDEKHLNSEYPSVREKMESLIVPPEYREAVLEKVIRAMLIINGWLEDDPGLDEAVRRAVVSAKIFDESMTFKETDLFSLNELKLMAEELGISKDKVRLNGRLLSKQSWLDTIWNHPQGKDKIEEWSKDGNSF